MIPGSVASILLGDGGQYQISRSLRLRASVSAYLNRTLVTPTNNTTWSLSMYLKRGSLGSLQELFGASTSGIAFSSSDALIFVSGGSTVATSTALFRDPSAYGHLFIRSNGTNIVASWNNNQILSYTGTITALNSAIAHSIGALPSPTNFYDGYLSEVVFVDGQALTPSSFAETDLLTGLWNPKKYSGTYGTNGFYLNFSDNSAATATTIGKDLSGNGNNWTPNNVSVTAGATNDSLVDVPTDYTDGGNGRGNYAVMNPLVRTTNNSGSISQSNGNLSTSIGGFANTALGTISVSSGKWYWEITPISNTSTGAFYIGVVADGFNSAAQPSADPLQWAYYGVNGNKLNNGNVAYGAGYTLNDVIGVALDLDSGTLTFYKNGTSQGTAFTNLAGKLILPSVSFGDTGSMSAVSNFGQRPFASTIPTGFKALNTYNLPDPLIKLPNKYFDATAYAGTGVAKSVSNSGTFQPDLVWPKSRSTANSNILVDSTRGATNYVVSNTTAAESTDSTLVSSINSDGFSIGTNAVLNTNGSSNVAWQWKKGTIPGFDIVAYTGTGGNLNVNHSLGVIPKLIMGKNRTGTAANWQVWHSSIGDNVVQLNLTNAQVTSTANGVYNVANISSSVFSVGTAMSVSAATYITYLWSEVPGFSKFGTYTGNGSADGPFVHCGFKPRYVLSKRTDSTGSWVIHDTTRDINNLAISALFPNLSNAESTSFYQLDILSNGFKQRNTDAETNASGGVYIYAAFAENPFKYARAR